MDFRVLGALEVWNGGQPVRLQGAKPRALLAIFLSRPGHAVATDTLIDELWEGEPPVSAATALRVHLTAIRNALEPDRPARSPSVRLPAAPPGYRLSIEPDELDAQRFERLVVMARRAADDGTLTDAVTTFEEALAIWRGAAFADTRDLSCLRTEIARLDELRLGALEQAGELRLALGEHLGMIGQLEAAIDANPWREGFTRQLMIALYRSGRQAEALRAYDRLETVLREELGIEPGAAVRATHLAVLDQDPALAWTPPDRRVSHVVAETPTRPRPLVGREHELDTLHGALAAVHAGEPRLVVVSGPAGIGKTTLAGAFAREAVDAGALALSGRCDADVVGPYQPFVEALRGYARAEPDAFATAADPLFGDLARLVPELGPDDATADVDRYRLFESVAALFARAGRPVVLVVDDLHWADADTVLLLRHLVRHPDVGRLLIVATVRDLDVAPGEPVARLLHDTGRDGTRTTVPLAGFASDEVAEYLRVHAPAPLLAEVLPHTETVHDITGGNPLFVQEVLHHLAEEVHHFDAGILRSLAPAGVRDLVEQRQTSLSPTAVTALRLAAVIGQQFTLPVLLLAGDLEDAAGLEAVEEALGARLVLERPGSVDEFAFTHGLFRNVIYDGLSASRRARLHRAVGEALEVLTDGDEHVPVAELAHHFVEAAPTGVALKAVHYSIAAGDEALAGTAYEDAAGHYRRALSLAPIGTLAEPAVGRTTLDLGRALDGTGAADEARDHYVAAADIARRIKDGALLADAATAFAGPWVNYGELNQRLLELIDDGLALLGDRDPVRRTRLLNLKAGVLYTDGPTDEEAELVAEALSLGRALADPQTLVAALSSRYRMLWHGPEHLAERYALAQEMVEIADRADLPELRLSTRRGLLSGLLEAGAIDEFGRELDAYASLAQELRRPAHVWSAATMRATQVLLRGDLDEAAELVERARDIGERTQQPHAFGAHLLQSFAVRFHQGRLADVADRLEVPRGDYGVQPSWHALVATIMAETGRRDEAVMVIDRVAGNEFAAIPRDAFWLAVVSLLAGAAATARADAHLETLEALLAPYADCVVVFGVGGAVFGVVHHWLGRLATARGRRADAVAHHERARAASADLDAAFWRAQAELDLSDLHPRAYDDERAAELRAGAVAYAERVGSGRLLAQAGRGSR